MDEIQAFAPSPVMQALYDALNNPLSEYCLGYEPNLCENLGLHLSYQLSSTGVSYLDLMTEIQAFAVGVETSDCIVSWSDSTGNSVGEGFSLSGLAAGTYTASLNHSNGCTNTKTIEVLLECNGCTHENASNYNSTATIEDGTCLYSQETHDAGYEAGAASVECPPCANSDCRLGTSLLMGTSGLMTSSRCCRFTTHLVRNKPSGLFFKPKLSGGL